MVSGAFKYFSFLGYFWYRKQGLKSKFSCQKISQTWQNIGRKSLKIESGKELAKIAAFSRVSYNPTSMILEVSGLGKQMRKKTSDIGFDGVRSSTLLPDRTIRPIPTRYFWEGGLVGIQSVGGF